MSTSVHLLKILQEHQTEINCIKTLIDDRLKNLMSKLERLNDRLDELYKDIQELQHAVFQDEN